MSDFTFDAPTHTYRVDGHMVPHVTGIIAAVESFYGVPPATLEFASERGRAVHLACELLDQNDLDESSIDPEVAPYLAAYRAFIEDAKPEWSAIEKPVYCVRYRYAGTLDRVGILRGLKGSPQAVVDIKCVAGLSPATGLQLAAYEAADRNDQRKAIRARYALQLRPDGTYRLVPYDEPTDYAVFLAQLTVSNWCARHGRQQEIDT